MTMTLGVLVYSVVLGFFNDYTTIIHTESYSVTFALAIIMQLLTYLTFKLKDIVVAKIKNTKDSSKLLIAFGVWLVMFFSKFVFLWVIDLVFREYVQVSGFIGLLIVIIAMTAISTFVTYVFKKLA